MRRKLVAFAVVTTILLAPALRAPARAASSLPELSPPPASSRFT